MPSENSNPNNMNGFINQIIVKTINKNLFRKDKINMSLPNWRLPTMGGHFFWNTLDERNGFKLQRNKNTGHFRILDPSDYRIDWSFDGRAIRNSFYQITSPR